MDTSYVIDVQIATQTAIPLTIEELIAIAEFTLKQHTTCSEITLRIVEPTTIQALNHQYRQQNKVTNVLAFPSELPAHIQLDHPLLGDVIICPEVLLQESLEQKKTLQAHWAHIIIHGILHLLQFNHIQSEETIQMQQEEIKLLHALGFSNPYITEDYTLE